MSWQAFVNASLRDKHGKLTIFQRPNAPIIIWLACTVLNKFTRNGTMHEILEIAGFAALLVWAWLEIAYGVNYFRRILGAVVFIFSIMLHSGAL